MTIQDAAKYFNVSEKTIHRRIDQNKLKAEKDNRRWIVYVDGQEFQTNDQTALIAQLQSENEYFRGQNKSLIQQLAEQNQLLLEDQRHRSWFRQLLRRW